MKSARSHHNPLIRRVQRHSSLASLFRAGDDQPVKGSAGSQLRLRNGEAGGLPLVKAFLPKDGPAFAPQAEANPASAPTMYHARQAPAAVEQLAQMQVYQPARAASAEQPAQPRVENISSQVEPLPARLTEPPARQATGQGSASEEDRTWRRLQNIFRRHTEKKQASEEETPTQEIPPEQQEKPATIQMKASDAATQAVQPARQEYRPAASGDAPARQPDPPGQQKTIVPPVQMRRSPENPPLASQRFGGHKAAQATESGSAKNSLVENSPEAALTGESRSTVVSAQNEAGPPATPSGSASPGDEIIEMDLLTPNKAKEVNTTIPTPELEPEAEQPEPQGLPLEAVWAVQRNQAVEDSAVPTVISKGASAASVESQAPSHETPGEEAESAPISSQEAAAYANVIRQALHNVQPSQASGSAIEYVPPRRPRPTGIEPPGSGPAPEQAGEVAAQKLPEVGATTIQRQPVASFNGENAEEELVPTEIGLLPHDLWQLIGEAPPAAAGSRKAGHSVAHRSEEGWKQQEIHAVQGNRMQAPETPATPAAHPAPVVQRRALAPSGAAPDRVETKQAALGQTTGGQQSEEAGTEEGTEADIEELARQVYTEVRRRLDLDWERTRKR